MQRTHIYLPESLNREINSTAKAQRKSKSEVIRQALERGIKAHPQQSQSAKALLDLAEMAKKLKGRGPADLSANHDYYIWGVKKRSKG